jgi:hypothetical protein
MATANPNFDIQHKTLKSLRQVHLICFGLEGLHILASFMIAAMGHFAGRMLNENIYRIAAMTYFFMAVFAHVVLYYVLTTIEKTLRAAYKLPASRSYRMNYTLLPLLLAHSISILYVVVRAGVPYLALVLGLLCWVRVFYALRSNSQYVQSFMVFRPSSDMSDL